MTPLTSKFLAHLLLMFWPQYVAVPFTHVSGGGSITEQEAPITNNFTGTSLAFGSNVTSGWMLLVGADENNTTTPTIGGSGSGCSSTTWTLRNSYTATSPNTFVWTGIASGTGACT